MFADDAGIFVVSFDIFPSYLDSRRPRGGIIEQVSEIDGIKFVIAGDVVKHVSDFGISPGLLKERGYAFATTVCNMNTFFDILRPRLQDTFSVLMVNALWRRA